MKKNSLHKGQHVLVVGAGKSGMAACRLLHSKGCEVCLTDGRPRSSQNAADLMWLEGHHIIQEFGEHHTSSFVLADLIVVSPGVPLDIEPLKAARAAGVQVIGELELGCLFFTGSIIAITGTNGKTTVTSMVGEALRQSGMNVFVGGNIGTPFCSHVVEKVQADVAVLEVSSFQLDSCDAFQPKVGLLLNISPDHLDRYGDYATYGDSKMRLFMNQTAGDYAVLNMVDAEVCARKSKVQATIVGFNDKTWLVNAEEQTLVWFSPEAESETYSLQPQQVQNPNLENCMAAISGARLMGATKDGVQHMLSNFRIPPHRLTTVGVWDGVAYINDSKATNIGAVVSALSGMQQDVILLAGGRDKGGDYKLLRPEVSRIVKELIVIGEAAILIQEALSECTTVRMALSMEDAVEQASRLAKTGDTVLLSPACASFDMFASYEERGLVFTEQVNKVMGKRHNTARAKKMQRAV